MLLNESLLGEDSQLSHGMDRVRKSPSLHSFML